MRVDRSEMVGQSRALQELFSILAKAAPTESCVLVTGEPGTGRHLLARILHKNSRRKDRPFLSLDCGTVPGEQLESELFGRETEEKETAPSSDFQKGIISRAQGGSLLLARIEKMDVDLQARILHVLQKGTFTRAGGTRTHTADVRIMAATSEDLAEQVARGMFREDLLYRLNVIPMHLPPLRERTEDLPLLMDAFLQKFCRERHRPLLRIHPETLTRMEEWPWPGNVRELEHLVEGLTLTCEKDSVTPDDLPARMFQHPRKSGSPDTRKPFPWPSVRDMQEQNLGLKEFFDLLETRLLTEAMEMAGGVKNQAAEILGIKRTTLIEKLKKKHRG